MSRPVPRSSPSLSICTSTSPMPAYFGNRRSLKSGVAGDGGVPTDQVGNTFLTIFGSDLVVWYDASDAASITHVGGAVSQWSDKSGNGFHVVQATGANKPTYSATGLGGAQPSLSFDGGDYLTTAGAATVASGAVSNFSVFVVGRMNAATTANGRFAAFIANGELSSGNNTGSVILFLRNGSNQEIAGLRNGGFKGVTSVTYDTTFRASGVWNGGNHTAYNNNVAGTTVADASGALAATGRLIIGAAWNAGAVELLASITGHVSEFALVKAAPSAGQLTSVQTMLAAKWTA
jgi:hypothetical protein